MKMYNDLMSKKFGYNNHMTYKASSITHRRLWCSSIISLRPVAVYLSQDWYKESRSLTGTYAQTIMPITHTHSLLTVHQQLN